MARGAGAKEAKAAAAADKDAAARKASEAKEAAKWDAGAKGKGKADAAAEKAAAAAAAKKERERLLAEEEASTASKPKPAPAKKAAAKPKPKPAAAAAPAVPDFDDVVDKTPASYSASNLDDALDAMTLVNEKTDKASVGARAAIAVDAHPERRFKAAFEAYKEAELPGLRKSHPGLRLQQYNDLMFKDFKTSPLNPFNQVSVNYDATKEEKVAALKQQQEAKEARLRAT